MPVLKRYENRPGYYIHARGSKSVITFQVSPRARNALKETGYADQSSVPWTVVESLYETGAIYTHKSGVDTDVSTFAEGGPERARNEILQYLGDQSSQSVEAAVNDLVVDSSLNKKKALATITDAVIEPEALSDFAGIPSPLIDLVSNSEGLGFEYETESGFKVMVEDLRWVDTGEKIDFRVCASDINNNGVAGLSDGGVIECEVFDGWIVSWNDDETTMQRTQNDDYEAFHNQIFRDIGAGGSFGYTPREEPYELIQRIFLFVDHYDIKPNARGDGHKRFASLSELEGRHIWIKPTTTTSSSGDSDNYQITCELRDFQYSTTKPGQHHLVVVPDKAGAHAEPIKYRSSNSHT